LSTIADSNAFRDRDRLLPQHQAALTLLQARLSDPETTGLSWLDLACGRGQIILSLDTNLSGQARGKISFCAYDIDQQYARETERAAARLKFADLRVHVGALSDFNQILPPAMRFDFITLNNTVHEIEPSHLAELLASCLGRLTNTGRLFIYDMDRITPHELGAIPWTRDDMRRIVHRLLDALGASEYRPEIGLWNHRTCNGWNVQIERHHLRVSPEQLLERAKDAVRAASEEILNLMRRRLSDCRSSLETLTKFGAQTEEEEREKEGLLYELWALSRALERAG